MSDGSLTRDELAQIRAVVSHFSGSRHLFGAFAEALIAHFRNSQGLAPFIHFIKYRIKDPKQLEKKLARKLSECKSKGTTYDVDESNLFEKVTDLAGVRLLHLHTEQMREIHKCILEILDEQKLRLVEPPVANCWDIEYERIFKEMGIESRSRDSMYSTVHYIIEANQKTKITCELQVRTLMDEVWGEVSHRVNYPQETKSNTCKEQLKVLARLTSGCTRLVDSIFSSHLESLPRPRQRRRWS